MLPTSPATLNPSPAPPSSSCQKERGDLNASTPPRPYLPSQTRCNDRRWHGRCLYRYRCCLPHFVDCCLPPQFLLLSATAIAIVATAATAEIASAAVTIAIRPCRRRNCPCRPCTCPLRRPPASLPSPSPTSLPSPSLAHVTYSEYFGTYLGYLPTNPMSHHSDTFPANPSWIPDIPHHRLLRN
jgi:hypothetical protein